MRKKTLQPIIEKNVESGSTVHTDELKSYGGLSKAGYDSDEDGDTGGERTSRHCRKRPETILEAFRSTESFS